MPTLPLPRCSVAGCNERTFKRGKSYCLRHQREIYKEDAKFNADPFYWSKAWRAVRARQLLKQSLCEECLKIERLTKANTVDHIVPRERGGSDYEESNLQSLCESCHNKKRAAEKKAGIKRAGTYTPGTGGDAA